MTIDELDAEREGVGMTVVGFCDRFGIPTSTWYRWRSVGTSAKGPWPTPAQDAVEADAKAKATTFEGWGHRKLAELLRVDDGHAVSDSTVFRVLDRNGLCLPAGYTGEVRQLARVRKETFIAAPIRRNRLWQADFSEFETNAGGTWNLGGVIDYWAKTNLACTVSVTKTASDAINFFEAALAEVELLLGITWIEDLTDPATGEIGTLALVTDNGPCFKSKLFAAWVASKGHLVHVRTRNRSPHTNGVIERFFGAIKYERLYRADIDTSLDLEREITDYRTIYNAVRPHEGIDMARPLDRYRQTPTTNIPNDKSVPKA